MNGKLCLNCYEGRKHLRPHGWTLRRPQVIAKLGLQEAYLCDDLGVESVEFASYNYDKILRLAHIRWMFHSGQRRLHGSTISIAEVIAGVNDVIFLRHIPKMKT